MLEKYHKLQPKSKTTDALQIIWEELSQENINKAEANFSKCWAAYMAVAFNGGHFDHLHLLSLSASLHPDLSSVHSHQQMTGKANARNAEKWKVFLVEIA